MKVNDLYTIVRELRQITILQENLMVILRTDAALSDQRTQLTDATARLQGLLSDYEQYSI